MNTRVVRNSEMALIDGQSHEKYGIPSMVLMEAAGLKAYLLARRMLWNDAPPSGACVFLAGRGNNGGDALVMARHALIDGAGSVTVVAVSGTLAGDAAAELEMVRRLDIPVIFWETEEERARRTLESADFLFDGLSGTGQKGALRSPLDGIAASCNRSSGIVIAIDIPSGLYDGFRKGEPAVRAHHTITMGLPKLCMYMPHSRVLCGDIHTVDPGFPPDLLRQPDSYLTLICETPAGFLPAVGPDTYKNRRGSVAVFAGSSGTTGAAELCSLAALRSRAGLVSVFAGSETYPYLTSRLTSVMVKPWSPEADPGSFEFGRYTSLLAGPGWGTTPDRQPWLRAMIDSGVPGVLDADGIRVLGTLNESGTLDLGGRWVLTPHPGEFAALLSLDSAEAVTADPVPLLLDTARKLNAVIILKGHVSMLGTPDGRLGILDGMNPALATAGSGDILAGIAAGVLSGGTSAVTAGETALRVQLIIGREAFSERGWFISEDLLPYISKVFARI